MKKISCAAAFVIIALFSVNAPATTLERLDMNAMASQATDVIVGTVMSTRTETVDGQVLTFAEIAVTDSMLGVIGGQVTVAVPGGTVQRSRFPVREVVAGAPRMFAGQKLCLFLSANQKLNAHQIVGFNQGLLTVDPSGEVRLPNGQSVPAGELLNRLTSSATPGNAVRRQ